jgi:hypothetical protein
MKHRFSIWEQFVTVASAVGGVLFGFVTSLAWFAVVMDRLPASAWVSRDFVLGGIFTYIAVAGIFCWVCGAKAQKWTERHFEKRRRGPST